jgi:hypothetical protein
MKKDCLLIYIGRFDESFVLLTQQMTSVQVSALQTPKGSLEHLRDEIIAAVDFLATGI